MKTFRLKDEIHLRTLKNLEEGLRWLEQAERDLEDAKILLESSSFASSSFHAQQESPQGVPLR